MDSPRPLMRHWRRLRQRLRPEPIATAGAFKAFVEERAWLIAQKCAIDYCRGKTGLASYALFTEKPFLDALDVCRWETFAAVLGDLLIIAEGHLRVHAPADQRLQLRGALASTYSSMLAATPAPSHRKNGWGEAMDEFAARLEAAGTGEPRRALDVADHSAKRLFDTLPIHLNMRRLDEEVVYGAVRFRMVAVSQEMQRRLRGLELAARLLAG
ncbi:MAG: hypothetical protein IT518_11155 [Burkholderiales bacterium]|nr:hypothetical protein [Burkholderiales bacterium]